MALSLSLPLLDEVDAIIMTSDISSFITIIRLVSWLIRQGSHP